MTPLTHKEGLRLIDEFFSSPLSAMNLPALSPSTRHADAICVFVEAIDQPVADNHNEARSFDRGERAADGHILSPHDNDEADNDNNDENQEDKVRRDQARDNVEAIGQPVADNHNGNYSLNGKECSKHGHMLELHDHCTADDNDGSHCSGELQRDKIQVDDDTHDLVETKNPNGSLQLQSDTTHASKDAHNHVETRNLEENLQPRESGGSNDNPIKTLINEGSPVICSNVEVFKSNGCPSHFTNTVRSANEMALEERSREASKPGSSQPPEGLQHEPLPDPDLHHLTNNDRAHGTGVVDNSTRRNRALSSGDYEYNLEPLSSAASFQRQSRKRLKMTRRSTMTDFSYSSLPLSQHEQRPRRRSSLASTSSDDFCNISPASSAGNQLDVVIDLHESLTKPPQSHYADEPYNSELVDRRPTYRSRHDSVFQVDEPITTNTKEKDIKLSTHQHTSPEPNSDPSTSSHLSTSPKLSPVIYHSTSHAIRAPSTSPLTAPPSPQKTTPRGRRYPSTPRKGQITPVAQSRWNRELIALAGRRAPPSRRQTRASSILQHGPNTVGAIKSRKRRKAMR